MKMKEHDMRTAAAEIKCFLIAHVPLFSANRRKIYYAWSGYRICVMASVAIINERLRNGRGKWYEISLRRNSGHSQY